MTTSASKQASERERDGIQLTLRLTPLQMSDQMESLKNPLLIAQRVARDFRKLFLDRLRETKCRRGHGCLVYGSAKNAAACMRARGGG